jgi:adenylate cyclase
MSRHARRIALSLLPLGLALLHALGLVPMGAIDQLDRLIQDTRLRATMPRTLEPRVVIVDIDERSLAELGRWPWGRHHLARLVDHLFEEQGVALLGIDLVFAEPDESSGLIQLQRLAQGPLSGHPQFVRQVEAMAPGLDHDAQLARAIEGRAVVLGYYFTSDRQGHTNGALPHPVMQTKDLGDRRERSQEWSGYGANIEMLARAAPRAGFLNAAPDSDGIVRALPLLARHQQGYHESLALAMFRALTGQPRVEPGFPSERLAGKSYDALESVVLRHGTSSVRIPVDDRLAVLVPFRGPGGPQGGSFQYVSAADVLAGGLPAGSLSGKIVLLGTTSPGLQDVRATPVGEAYPGVETHASLLAGLLDGHIYTRPDYAMGYELVMLVLVGLALALLLPRLKAARALAASALVVFLAIGLNTGLYLWQGLVLPLASVLVVATLIFVVNMSHGYLFESRARRELAQLFGTYVPPELVDEMVKDPDSYSMAASTRELTVMFCDMRGFTHLSEGLAPAELQTLLNTVFSRLTQIIRIRRGTIDKYMGDCVMAFWGAPVETEEHATLAVQAALEMTQAIADINRERFLAGQSPIGVGIGLNTGDMCVGDMGSDVRRSYTVVGDAVNLGSRLEGLCRFYGVDNVASEVTRQRAPGFVWQELDRVRVKGKAEPVTIYSALCPASAQSPALAEELQRWEQALSAWRRQDWVACETHLNELKAMDVKKVLYQLWTERVVSMKRSPPPPGWDGVTSFETK